MRRVLVLGAGGFIGARLLSSLARTDWALPIAGFHRPGIARQNGSSHVAVDSTNMESLTKALADVDDVINCVTGSGRTISNGALTLFKAAANAGHIGRIVHLSTMSVYGSAQGVVDESSPLNGTLGWYSRAKVRAEEYAQEYARTGRTVVILRPGCVYGPGSELWTGRIGRWLSARRVGDLGAAGDGICNLVFIDDVVTAAIAALSTPSLESQAINLVAPDSNSWNRYFVQFARAINAVPVRRISERRLKMETRLAAPILKVAALLAARVGLDERRLPEPVPPSLARLWRQEIQLDSRRAEAELGLVWTPIGQGMAASACWFFEARKSLPVYQMNN